MRIISSNIRAVTEVVEDNIDGFLIPPVVVKTVVDRIKYLPSNRENCRAIGTNGGKIIRSLIQI